MKISSTFTATTIGRNPRRIKKHFQDQKVRKTSELSNETILMQTKLFLMILEQKRDLNKNMISCYF